MTQNKSPAVVFVHPFGGSSKTWTEVLNLLERDVHCVTHDFLGFGHSCDQGETGSHQICDYVDELSLLVRNHNLKSFGVVGHSMGGKIALSFAARKPPGLQWLLLLAPSPPTPEPISEESRRHLLKAFRKQEILAQLITKITFDSLPAEVFARTLADYMSVSPAAWEAWLTKGSKENISSKMNKISVPVAALSGDADAVIPIATIDKEIRSQLLGVTVKIIKNSGHLLPLEQPLEVARIIRERLI